MNRKVAGDFQFSLALDLSSLGLEGYGRIFGDIEKMGAAQIIIAPLDTRVDCIRVKSGVNLGLCGVGWIVNDRAASLFEYAANCRDTQMPDGKLRSRVVGINL